MPQEGDLTFKLGRWGTSIAPAAQFRFGSSFGAPQLAVELFVRKRAKTSGGKTENYIYCGAVDFVDWQGNLPITVRWKLRAPLSDELARLFDD